MDIEIGHIKIVMKDKRLLCLILLQAADVPAKEGTSAMWWWSWMWMDSE